MPKNKNKLAWQAHVLTLFPEMFPGPLGISLVGKALQAGIWSLDTVPLRDFGVGPHRAVDGRPAGGGAGMIMRADVLGPAISHARSLADLNAPLVYLTPRGTPLTQAMVHQWAQGPGIILLAGRFEGIDERVIQGRSMHEVSIGDYVLSGGELAAMVLLDAVVRLLPGVLGAADSIVDESFESGLLEYPQYTKPREWEDYPIPEVLLSGDHEKIAAWRRKHAELITRQHRPDLWAKYRPDLWLKPTKS